jgi:hypothetical protein
LKAGLWFRRTRLVMVSPVHGNHAALRPKIHLSDLSSFPEPALSFTGAWIETSTSRQPLRPPLGRSFKGAWIETVAVASRRREPGGRSFTGAWIETSNIGSSISRISVRFSSVSPAGR